MIKRDWDVMGIELLPTRYDLGRRFKRIATHLSRHWYLRAPRYQIERGDMCKNKHVPRWLKPTDSSPVLVVINSFAWAAGKLL